jgi:hypothetical protein
MTETPFRMGPPYEYDLRSRKENVPRRDPNNPEVWLVPCCTRLWLNYAGLPSMGQVDVFLRENRKPDCWSHDWPRMFHSLGSCQLSPAPFGTMLLGLKVSGCAMMITRYHDFRPCACVHDLNIVGWVGETSVLQTIPIRVVQDHARQSVQPQPRFSYPPWTTYVEPGQVLKSSLSSENGLLRTSPDYWRQ